MAAQATMMTIHPDPQSVYKSKTLQRFEISPKLAVDFKVSLRRLDITPATVFPGLDGLAKSIRYEGA
jgi:hypothetical protein